MVPQKLVNPLLESTGSNGMNALDLVKRADEILQMGRAVLATAYSTGGRHNINYVKSAPMAGFRSAVLSFIEKTFGKDHPHFQQFTTQTENDYRSSAEDGMAILEAIRGEIAGGWLFTVKGLVASELFADFITMAEHLFEAGYKDPAAVMAGSVLEEHLRQLCIKHKLETEDERDGKQIPRKADRLNADLTKVDIYTKLDQKLITAWLDLRNNAAHGKYDAYSAEHVKQMIAGILGFIARVTL